MSAIKPGTRTNFIDGMLLTAETFRTEQDYLDRRIRHFGRLVGSGVLAGFHVTCRDPGDTLTVEPGVAVDPAGCDLFLGDAREIKALEGLLCISRVLPFKETGAETGALPAAYGDEAAPEDPESRSPVLRKTEQIALSYAGGYNEIHRRNLVPIAWVRRAGSLWQIFQMPGLVSISPRTAVPACITAVHPKHGASFSPWTERLWIEFSTPIDVPPPEAFEVFCGGRPTIGFQVKELRLSQDPRKLLFNVVSGAEYEDLANATIIWRLHCDFVVDKRGVPVSGAHFAGKLPSPGGMAGGMFQSWFTIGEPRR